jgi:hypothetical protein
MKTTLKRTLSFILALSLIILPGVYSEKSYLSLEVFAIEDEIEEGPGEEEEAGLGEDLQTDDTSTADATSDADTPGAVTGEENTPQNNYYNTYTNQSSNYNDNYNSNTIDLGSLLGGYFSQSGGGFGGYGYGSYGYPYGYSYGYGYPTGTMPYFQYQMPTYGWYNYGTYMPINYTVYIENYYDINDEVTEWS